jgi:hypothetical protein
MDTPDTGPSSPSEGPDRPPPAHSVPAPPRQRFPSLKQALVTFAGGIVLSATACVGFLISLGGNFERGGDEIVTPLAAILFCVGVLGFLVGLILLIIRIVRGR